MNVRLHYPLVVISVINLFYYADRFVIFILVEPIRLELGLSDGQMGFITGAAFAISYVLLAIPVGRLTDTGNRVHLLSAAVTIWCAFTAMCGWAKSYGQLIAYRVGVACGEAAGFIPAQSLVADHYPAATRSRANAVFMSSANFGKILAFSVAGILNELVGWRMTFVIIGLCGLFLGPLLFLTVKEPARGVVDDVEFANTTNTTTAMTTRESIRHLLSRRAYVLMISGYAIAAVAHYSMLSWLPTFFIRRFGFDTGEAGLFTSVVVVVPGLVGMLAAGILSDRLFRRDPKWVAWIPALALALAGPTLILQVFAPNLTMAVMFGLVPAVAVGVYVPPLLTGIQTVSGARMRGTGGAVLLVALLLVGQGVGPALSGFLSDLFAGENTGPNGSESLRNALACISLLYVVGAAVIFRAGRYIRGDMVLARRVDALGAVNT
jgi:MFS family permease